MYDASMTLAVLTITMDKECTNHIDLSCQTQIFPMSVTNGLGKFSDVASSRRKFWIPDSAVFQEHLGIMDKMGGWI